MATKVIPLLLVMTSVKGGLVSAEELKCKPREGCDFTKCDPISTISISALNDREYSIICEGITHPAAAGTVTRQEYDQLQNQLRVIQAELTIVKLIEMPRLKAQNEKKVKTKQTKNPLIPPKPCSLRIGNICLFLIQVKTQGYHQVDAEDECRNRGASLAVITSSDMYNTLVSTLRQQQGTWTYTMWTGMVYNFNRNAPKNGFAKWAPGYPNTNVVVAMYMAIRVASNPQLKDQGMINSEWHVKYGSVLCQWIDE